MSQRLPQLFLGFKISPECILMPELGSQSRHEHGEFFSINFGGSTLRLAYVVLGKGHKEVVSKPTLSSAPAWSIIS